MTEEKAGRGKVNIRRLKSTAFWHTPEGRIEHITLDDKREVI
jgi:hypothetical protein